MLFLTRVRHRIDGLENAGEIDYTIQTVRHRIDGLENTPIKKD